MSRTGDCGYGTAAGGVTGKGARTGSVVIVVLAAFAGLLVVFAVVFVAGFVAAVATMRGEPTRTR
jgi:hypothetical protein